MPPTDAGTTARRHARRDRKSLPQGLGPLLCWAVVFADIGTSVYYTPGILFSTAGVHAALFVALTLIVFVLLTVKYAEVAIRYPEGGGVVTVGAHAIHPVAGLVGGLFILVDYFLTSALSALSGLIYLSVFAPDLIGIVTLLTVVALVLLAGLNLIGINADAKVTAVIAVVALGSQLAVVIAVLIHAGFGTALGAIPKTLSGPRISPIGLLTGYAGAFLAFSGLESISQLAPAMRRPQRLVAPRAMVIVVFTIIITSPLLTLWSTTLLNAHHINPNQFVSALGGYAAGPLLQTEVAASAGLLLIFASNTAIIGCYHVFLALSKLRFLPQVLQHRNRWRNTPHWSILAAIAVPIAVVVISQSNVGLLGDMYAFGLLGAFSVTSVCLDIVRWRERRSLHGRRYVQGAAPLGTSTFAFTLGVITSVLVVTAWVTNLFAKPLATLFGGCITVLGLAIAWITYRTRRRAGLPGILPMVQRLGQFPRVPQAGWQAHQPVMVLLHGEGLDIEALVDAGIADADGGPLGFAFIGTVPEHGPATRLLEILDPYVTDEPAHDAFREVQRLARARHQRVHLVYAPMQDRAESTANLWTVLDPRELIVLRCDEAALAAIVPGTGRHTQTDGVELTIHSA
ncbi:MAG: APC family permease [Candidatus Dormiibacterota bacterium]